MDNHVVERLAYRPAEAAVALGVSRPTVYQLMHRTDFPSLKIGTRTLIPVDGLKRWLEAQSNGGVGDDRKQKSPARCWNT